MKTSRIIKTTILFTVIMITITSIAMHHTDIDAKEKTGLQVITALQRSSTHEFSALFPTLADFHQLMIQHSELYGKNLTEAAREFEKEFENVLTPAFKNTFETILKEGKESGIDWRTAKFVSAEVPENIQGDFSVVPMTITFTAQGKEHRLNVEKAFYMNGQWKISQFMSLDK